MLKGTLEQIPLYHPQAAAGCLNDFDAMLWQEPNPNKPITDNFGNHRTLFLYIPSSGVIPCSSGVVLMRDGNDEASARHILAKTGWAELAERDGYVILLPNSVPGGWNVSGESSSPDDLAFAIHWLTTGIQQYLLGCKVHRTSVYLAGFGHAATFAAMVAAQHSSLLASVYLDGAKLPSEMAEPSAPVPAWLLNCDSELEAVFGPPARTAGFPFRCFQADDDPQSHILHRKAWDYLFLGLRRWPTGGYGNIVHKSTDVQMGLESYIDKTFLGDNGGIAHTWYEYAPENPFGVKLPLLFVLHGGSTSAKYCAEQNRWHELGEKYGFYVVYPQCSADAVWNAACDIRRLSDEEYLLCLYQHMLNKYPIDSRRIYCSGFSMGGLMTQCMGMIHNELFAAIAPFSGYLFHSFWNGPGINAEQPFALMHRRLAWTEQALAAGCDTRMPIIQFHGDKDTTWTEAEETRTRAYWAQRNGLSEPNLDAVPTRREGADQSFSIYDQCDDNGLCLYRFVTVANLPHAVDLRQPYMAWSFLAGFARRENSSLIVL